MNSYQNQFCRQCTTFTTNLLILLLVRAADMRENGQNRISIGGLDSASMESLIVYTYTSDIVITTSNVQRLLAAANLVQLTAVRRACCDFLERGLCPANCLGIHCFADTHACDSVAVLAFEYARAHFDAVAVERELRELPRHKLVELISSQDLNITNEEVVLQVSVCRRFLCYNCTYV